jgi:hypothetical protein
MCDLCKYKKRDSGFSCGGVSPKSDTFNVILRNIFVKHYIVIGLCYIHDIELFKIGEKRFLKKYAHFAVHTARGECGSKVKKR